MLQPVATKSISISHGDTTRCRVDRSAESVNLWRHRHSKHDKDLSTQTKQTHRGQSITMQAGYKASRQAENLIIEGAELQKPPTPNQTLILYTHMLCPFAQRTLLTLLYKEVRHQAIHIDLSDKPNWFIGLFTAEGLSPQVPFVNIVGKDQSDDIQVCRSICDTFQGSQYSDLKYSNLQDRQQVDALIESCSHLVFAGMDLLAGDGSPWQIGTGQTRYQWKAFEEHLDKFQAALERSGGPFLMGPEVSLADLMYMPFMERFAIAMPHFTSFDPCAACDGSIGDWLYEMQQLECCQIAAADHDLLLHVLKRERRLDFFQHSTYTAYQLHPHLLRQ